MLAVITLPLSTRNPPPDSPALAALHALAEEQRQMPLVLASGFHLGPGGAAAVVVTDGDRAFAQNLADDLAVLIWANRAELAADSGAEGPPPLYPFDLNATWLPTTGRDE